jgi:hypothetical protein
MDGGGALVALGAGGPHGVLALRDSTLLVSIAV